MLRQTLLIMLFIGGTAFSSHAASIIQTDPAPGGYESLGFDGTHRRLGQTFLVDNTFAVGTLVSIAVEITPEYDNSLVDFDLYAVADQGTSLYHEAFNLNSSFNPQVLLVDMSVPVTANTSYLFALTLVSDQSPFLFASLVANADYAEFFGGGTPVDAYTNGEYWVGTLVGDPLYSSASFGGPPLDLKFTATVIPVPSAFFLGVLGLGIVAAGRHRRRRTMA